MAIELNLQATQHDEEIFDPVSSPEPTVWGPAPPQPARARRFAANSRHYAYCATSIGGWRIVVKQVAPGVFFAIIGLAVIAVGVFRPIEITVPGGGMGKMSYTPPHNQPRGGTTPQPAPKKPDPLR